MSAVIVMTVGSYVRRKGQLARIEVRSKVNELSKSNVNGVDAMKSQEAHALEAKGYLYRRCYAVTCGRTRQDRVFWWIQSGGTLTPSRWLAAPRLAGRPADTVVVPCIGQATVQKEQGFWCGRLTCARFRPATGILSPVRFSRRVPRPCRVKVPRQSCDRGKKAE